LHLSAVVTAESNQVLAVDGAVDQRRYLLPLLDLAVEVFEWLDLDDAVFIGRDLDVFFDGAADFQEAAF
jgi:hypothetical protein